MTARPLRLTVAAPAAPDPHLLRAAIAERLAGRPFPGHAEDTVAERIAQAAHERLRDGDDDGAGEGPPWR